MPATVISNSGPFEIRFESLFDGGRALVFPCNAFGRVDLDAMPPRARSNYLYARAMVGRDYTMPRVQAMSMSDAPRKVEDACHCY